MLDTLLYGLPLLSPLCQLHLRPHPFLGDWASPHKKCVQDLRFLQHFLCLHLIWKLEERLLLMQIVAMRSPAGTDLFLPNSQDPFKSSCTPFSTEYSCKCLWTIINPILPTFKLPTIIFIIAFYRAAWFVFLASNFLLSSEGIFQYHHLPTLL